MPIHIDIYVNRNPIKSYHIGRMSGGTHPDDLNIYLIEETNYNDLPKWEKTVRFEHRYGDGIDVCIRKGLDAFIDERGQGL